MIMQYPDYQNKTVIITGASYGIGKSLALQLSEQGACLVLAARSKGLLNDIKEQCESIGGRALVVQTDVTDPDHCRTMVQRATEHYGRIDTLINNAGVCMISRFDEVKDLSHYERIMRVNYLGSVNCTYYCLPYLKQSQGHIVAIASLAGRTGVPLYSAYSASKHALIGFFESIRIELEDAGVNVTLMLPDFVSSGLHERSVDGSGCVIGKAHNIDYDHVMTPDECARLCIQAMTKCKREAMLTWRGRLGQWLKLLNPRFIDAITKKAIAVGR
jgi:short-subunit dehydrogenase